MAGIVVLDEITAGRIAAGEVLERPVSAVKELVENALDAGAARIAVDLTDGGLSRIVVTDNGCGISPEDAGTAFLRHATSKIKDAADLQQVSTLGFRGEALPSIAAVAKVEMTTRTHDAVTGVLVRVQGGAAAELSAAGCAAGTRVEVKDIFYNTPVRRKSMKSPSVEGGLCGETLSKIAFSRPDVRFDFTTGGRRVFYTPGTGKLADVLAAIYGAGQAKEMLPVCGGEGDLTLNGYVSGPALSRSTRNHQTIVVNGRYVRSSLVTAAVEREYRGLLSAGRRPVFVLSLTVAADKVDVNVHPAKLEVRLLEERRVAALVTGALQRALRSEAVIPAALPIRGDGYRLFFGGTGKPEREQLRMELPYEETVLNGVEPAAKGVEPAAKGVEPAAKGVEPAVKGVEPAIKGVEPAIKGVEPAIKGVEPAVKGVEPAVKGVEPAVKGVEPAADGVEPAADGVEPAADGVEPAPGFGGSEQNGALAAEILEKGSVFRVSPVVGSGGKQSGYDTAQDCLVDAAESDLKLPKLNPLSHLFPVYILAEGEDGLYIIDQHAAHERILYEECLAGRGDYPSQYLLVPETLELDHAEAVAATELLPEFNKAGFVIEHFGGNTFLLRGAPSFAQAGMEKELFWDMLDYYKEKGASREPEEFFKRLAASIACKGAIKAGEKMPYKTMEALLMRLARTENPFACPHGRPTIIHLSHRDLRARFMR